MQGSVSLPPATARMLKAYADHVEVRYGGRTAPQYVAHATVVVRWLAGQGVTLAATRTTDLAAFQGALFAARKLDGRPYSSSYQAVVLAAARNFFRFLRHRGYLLHDPAAELELPRVDKRLPRTVLSRDEARRVVEAPDRSPMGLRDRAILETLYATGIRASELIALTVYDVDVEERLLRVVMGKGRKDRNLPLTRIAARAIELYVAKARPTLLNGRKHALLFVQERGGRMWRSTASRIVR